MEMKLERFTLIGATTRTGLLAAPLRDRFPIQERLDYYATPELKEIATRAARKLALPVEEAAVEELAARARGTPRIAIRLLQRARDFAQVEGDGRLTREVVETTLRRLDVDARGLDAMDRRILAIVIDTFGGGPVGIDAVAASVGEESGTIEDVYEPFLVREGFLARTSRGRMALEAAYRHLGRMDGTRAAGRGAGPPALARPCRGAAERHGPGSPSMTGMSWPDGARVSGFPTATRRPPPRPSGMRTGVVADCDLISLLENRSTVRQPCRPFRSALRGTPVAKYRHRRAAATFGDSSGWNTGTQAAAGASGR